MAALKHSLLKALERRSKAMSEHRAATLKGAELGATAAKLAASAAALAKMPPSTTPPPPGGNRP